MRGAVANEGKANERIEATRFVSSFTLTTHPCDGVRRFTTRWLVGGLVTLLALAGNASRARAAEPPPAKPIPIVTMPYWAAGLAAAGVSLAGPLARAFRRTMM
jgi:hypothetical protein